MYIRFVIERWNADSHCREGLFQGSWRLEEECELGPEEISELEELFGWFGRHLISASHHQLHHERYNSNYGLYFRFWDRLFGTDVGVRPDF